MRLVRPEESIVRKVSLIGILVLASFSASATLAQDSGDARRGLAYARANCAECHGILATDMQSPRRGVATFKRIAETPGMTATAIAVWLQTSHPSMPNFVIPAEDRANIAAYILSLRDQRTEVQPAR